MRHDTSRRAVLGGLAAATVAGTGLYLGRRSRDRRGRWLRPAAPLADSPTFAFVRGVTERDGDLSVEVATRARHEEGREIELFADTDRPIRAEIPPLRGFWRFDADLGERPLGESTLSVGEQTLRVELVSGTPPHHDARVQLTPRVTWRSDAVAHVRGYSTGDGGGRVHVAFRGRTADPPAVDTLVLRTPEGRTVGRASVPAGVREFAFEVDPLESFAADGELLGFREGQKVDSVPLFYH
jgi:hypothetical protein